jgi:hypothetical protein
MMNLGLRPQELYRRAFVDFVKIYATQNNPFNRTSAYNNDKSPHSGGNSPIRKTSLDDSKDQNYEEL